MYVFSDKYQVLYRQREHFFQFLRAHKTSKGKEFGDPFYLRNVISGSAIILVFLKDNCSCTVSSVYCVFNMLLKIFLVVLHLISACSDMKINSIY